MVANAGSSSRSIGAGSGSDSELATCSKAANAACALCISRSSTSTASWASTGTFSAIQREPTPTVGGSWTAAATTVTGSGSLAAGTIASKIGGLIPFPLLESISSVLLSATKGSKTDCLSSSWMPGGSEATTSSGAGSEQDSTMCGVSTGAIACVAPSSAHDAFRSAVCGMFSVRSSACPRVAMRSIS